MVKTTTNPASEVMRTAQEASGRADESNDPADIDHAISEWEIVIQSESTSGTSEDQALIFSSCAAAFLKRWHVFHRQKDLEDTISNLKIALDRLSYIHAQSRYDLLLLLAEAHQLGYEAYPQIKAALLQAIHYWEDAYGLSVFLRCTKDSAIRILPNLANAFFVSFCGEISGLDSIHQAVNYYQLALLHVPLKQQVHLRLRLGKAYSELMYYEQEEKNAQCAIDNFEIFLENSQQEEERLEASNGKSRALFWMHVIKRDEVLLSPEDEDEDPFREWAEDVSRRYPKDATATFYYSASNLWAKEAEKVYQVWFNLAWSLYQVSLHQPPPEFHILYSLAVYWYFEPREDQIEFSDLPAITMGLEQLSLFAANINSKIIHIVQRTKLLPGVYSHTDIPPFHLEEAEWMAWKNETIDQILEYHARMAQFADRAYNEGPVFAERRTTDLEAQLQGRINRSTNLLSQA
ncbi:hypothetical protein CPB86DRAFT_829875 [Serendipita vermifera]|nr:hypothetical protein CPB86DRAFT_829875 [Serendipita vermifera]